MTSHGHDARPLARRESMSGPREPSSLPGLLAQRADELGDAPAYTYLLEGEAETATLSFRALRARAAAIAGFLRARHAPGSRVLLLFAPGLEFIEAFFGCLLADMIAVPTSLPRPSQTESPFDAIAADCAPSCALTAGSLARDPRERGRPAAAAAWPIHALTEIAPSPGDAPHLGPERRRDPDEVAYLQYTSGSTSSPKGVMVSHRNVLHNARILATALECAPGDTFVTWLPHFHDMGLIHGILLPLLMGGRCIVLPPASFLLRPARWLEAIARYRGHHSAAPNFAFDLCVASTTPGQRARLDLSSWRTVVNGAEPIRAESIARFLATFAPCGLRGDVVRPGYGLAEATLAATGVARRPTPRVLRVNAAELGRGRVRPCRPTDPDGQDLVSCGRPWLDTRVAIVDPERCTPLGESRVGEVWVAGDTVVRGYWQNERATQETFRARLRGGGDGASQASYLRTGDLGFLFDGELFVTGRLKDVIIVRGRNYYPQDIELAVSSAHEAFAADAGAVFGVCAGDGLSPPVAAPESLVVCQELRRGQRGVDLEELARAARRAVAQRFGLPVYAVVLLGPRRLPKTTSGKIQRRACKAAFLRGELEVLGVFHDARPQGAAHDARPQGAAHEAQPHGGSSNGAAERAPAEAPLAAPAQGEDWTARLTELAAEILHLYPEQIRWDTPLIDCGLESVKAVRLANRIAALGGGPISLVRLFDGMTLGELRASLARPAAPDGPALPNGPAAPDGVAAVSEAPGDGDPHAPFPTTDVQRAYLVGRGDAFDLGGVGCHGYLEIDRGELDLDRFERAWRRLIDRHDMLRAVFTADGMQRVLEAVPPFQVKVWDLRGETRAGAERALEDTRARLSHRVFDPCAWPLFDVGVSLLPGGARRIHINLDLLALDAWSIGILSRELELLVEAPDAELPPLGATFRDCVLDDLRHRRTPAAERSLEHWRERVASLPPPPELPLARSPRDVGRPRFRRRSGRLARPHWERLKDHARAHGLTPSCALLAAFAAVLGRWSARPELALTVTVFDRPAARAGADEILGDFTTIALVGLDLGRGAGLADVARAAQGELLRALEHRRVGALRALREGGGQGAPVVFTSTLGALAEGGAAQRAPFAWLGEEAFCVSQTPQVWLDHQVAEDQGDLVFSWDAVDALFPEGMVDAMFDAYRDVLARLSRDGAPWKGAAPVALPPAQRALREEVNRTERPARSRLLHEGFSRSAAARPEAPAVIAPDAIVTYGELDRKSNALARALRERGARPGALVALVAEKGWAQALGVLGILKSGAAYLPMDPAWPEARIHGLLEQAGVALVLTQARLAGALRWPEGVAVLSVDAPGGAPHDDAPLEVAPRPDDLAYVIFTSGSTGKPKGVAIDHRSAANTLDDVNERLGVGTADRVLALSSLTFDLSVYDLFGLWAAGGAVVLPDPELARDPAHWEDMMVRHRVTLWNTVPALMQMLVAHRAGRAGPRVPLRAALLSGDWIPVRLPDQIRTAFPDAAVVSLGGATEASIWSIAYPIGRVDPGWKSIPYGKPLANQRFHVLDGRLTPCPDWVPGRLYIGGAGLARGYWRDEERTAERFITHPETGERLYWTGDLGRFLPDGNIEFLGREDLQVKVQGYRIELEEVESALLGCPQVAGAAVGVGSSASGGKRLLGYVVPAAGCAIDAAALRAFVASRLPEHMVPSALIPLARLPLTSNGKVDRGALADPARVSDLVLAAGGDGAGAALAGEGGPGAPALLFDPVEKMRFKLGKPALRRDLAGPAIALSPAGQAEERLRAFARRRSHRRFREEPIPLERLSRLLSLLSPVELPGYPIPKHLYASAGGLYPVQVYLHVKPGRVEQLPGGTYYHHPERHALVPIAPGASVDVSVHAGPNRQAVESSAFSVHLVADLDAIEPVYGDRARDLCLVEAGIIAHLLESGAPDQELGLCQVGGVDAARIRALFALDARHEVLHGLVGGAISPADATVDALARESAPLRAMVALATREPLPPPGAPAAAGRRPRDEAAARRAGGALRAPEGRPREATAPGQRSPASEAERRMAALWAEVLQVEQVGADDGFFALGGDSLLGITLVERARAAGFQITARQLFACQTVARLVAACSPAGASRPDDERAPGERPLTLLQRWYLEEADHRSQPERWNMNLLLEVRAPLDIDRLRRAALCLVNHHEALRARFERTPRGWRQVIDPPWTDAPLTCVDLSAVPEAERRAELERRCDRMQDGYALERGRLFQIAYFRWDERGRGRLWLNAHHLVVDAVSMLILARDLQSLHDRLGATAEPELPPRGTSLGRWTRELERWTQTELVPRERAYWLGLPWDEIAPLPADHPRTAHRCTVASIREHAASLPERETASLLRDAPGRFGVSAETALVAALHHSVCRWTGRTWQDIMVLHAGRDLLPHRPDLDVSREVGWLSTERLLVLRRAGADEPAAALREIARQIERIPGGGHGYNLLRYLGGDAELSAALGRLRKRPGILFNYMGHVEPPGDGALLGFAEERTGYDEAETNLRFNLFECHAHVSGGRLFLRWRYSANAHELSTVRRIADDFIAFLQGIAGARR
ncbi:amino acid adenylation domain-containing protein [Sorangium sp. So ce1024]|uniref:amino acid adenylation domain-containing protein n=1 Tax=Sorangium sp. So ce1024 TaxID=3133327 RepID=UPI003F0D9F23